MTTRKLDEKVNKSQSGALPGVVKLNTDQGMGHYEWGKKVAGHDGKKQHSPVPSMGAFKDTPIAVGYTKTEQQMTKAAMGGKGVKQMTPSGSKETSDTNTKSPVRKFTEAGEAPAQQDQQDPNNPQDPNAQGQQPADAAPPVQQQQAPAPAPALDLDQVLEKLPEIVGHAKERKTLDPHYNKKTLTTDIAELFGAEATDPTVAKIVKFVSATEKISESFKDQVRGNERAKSMGGVLGKEPKKHPYNDRLVGEDEELDVGADKITLDVPLLIRVMEYAKEDAKTNMELRRVVERMLDIGGELTVDDYNRIVSNLDEDAVVETIRKVKGGYRLLSSKGKNLGTFDSKGAAEKHEREVQYFKHKKESVESIREEFKALKEAQQGVAEAMTPQQQHDFDRMRAGAMSRKAYDAKWKKPRKSDDEVIYGKKKGVAEGLNEFAPAGGGGNIPRGPKTPRRDPWGDNGEDPYQLRRYNRSADFFDQFDSNGVDKQKFDKATGEYEGYYFDRDSASGITQIAYFKFDNPAKIGDNDPGMGWYYEPVDEGVAEGAMPASVIKHKESIRLASDEENKKRFKGKTKAELAQMARRHGYKDKNPYAKFHDGVTESIQGVAESWSNDTTLVKDVKESFAQFKAGKL